MLAIVHGIFMSNFACLPGGRWGGGGLLVVTTLHFSDDVAPRKDREAKLLCTYIPE